MTKNFALDGVGNIKLTKNSRCRNLKITVRPLQGVGRAPIQVCRVGGLAARQPGIPLGGGAERFVKRGHDQE